MGAVAVLLATFTSEPVLVTRLQMVALVVATVVAARRVAAAARGIAAIRHARAAAE